MIVGLRNYATAYKSSPFFKLLSTRGIDFGGRTVLKKINLGLHLRVCYALINKIDSGLKYEMFASEDTPHSFFTFGVGFSW